MKRYNYITLAWAVFMLAVMLFPKKTILIKEGNADTEDYVFDVQALEDKILFFDKSVHFFLFGVFGFFLIRSIHNKYLNQSVIANAALALFICIVFGLIIECIQYYVPGRSFEFNDIVADTIGGLFGVLFFYYYSSKSKFKVLISSNFN